MKLTTYISASAFIFISALVIRNNEAAHQSESLYGTKWLLREVNTEHQSVPVETPAFIQFHRENAGTGGHSGCNSFGGSVRLEGNTVSFTDIVSTEMFCEAVQEQEKAFLSNLPEVTRYEIKGGVLSLFNNKKLLLRFVATR